MKNLHSHSVENVKFTLNGKISRQINFMIQNVAFTKFLPKKVRVDFLDFHTVTHLKEISSKQLFSTQLL